MPKKHTDKIEQPEEDDKSSVGDIDDIKRVHDEVQDADSEKDKSKVIKDNAGVITD